MFEKKRVAVTYFLWFTGGIFGLHHFYLGRDIQAFLWWCTLGGYFGFGWLRDLFKIPEYVNDVNNEPEFLETLTHKMRGYKKPPFSTIRFTGMMTIGYLFATLIHNAIPNEEFGGYEWKWLRILTPLGCAIGIWSVGNIGREEGNIWWPLGAAYSAYPLFRKYDGETSFTLMIMAAAYAFDWKSKKWRRTVKKRKTIWKRFLILSACASLYIFLLGCYFYFNVTVTDGEGEEIPIHEAIRHFFTSPWWTDVWQSLKDVYAHARAHGWAEVWKMIVDLSDPFGETNAYKILELSSDANQTTINSRCRQLAVKWHPDKVKDPELKIKAQDKFMEVQQACEILSTSKAKRRRKNKKSEL